MQTEM